MVSDSEWLTERNLLRSVSGIARHAETCSIVEAAQSQQVSMCLVRQDIPTGLLRSECQCVHAFIDCMFRVSLGMLLLLPSADAATQVGQAPPLPA